MNQEKEVLNLEKRLIELSRIAYQRDIVTYSDFLNLNEQNILHTLPKEKISTEIISFGGYETAERQMAAFIPDALYLRYGKKNLTTEEIGYPFCALRIESMNKKFAEELTHRDYLGAVLNLGIDRSRTGDIIQEESGAVIFVHNDIADFISENLFRIRHTSVTAQIASVRLDSLLALAFSSSRTKLTGLIEGARVYVNGRLVTSNGYQPTEGDIISVRGLGKFCYESSGGKTRKNRINVMINKYI